MKKLIALLLALVLALSLTACGKPAATLPVVDDDDTTQQGSWEMIDPSDEDDAQPGKQADQPEQNNKQNNKQDDKQSSNAGQSEKKLNENKSYYSKEDVALYIHTYGHLPKNYISKKDAQNMGWTGGSLEPFAPGCCIGGSHFGNYEGILPEAKGRSYTECDIGTQGKKSRGAKRIVFSNDGLIFYTDDHYESFELLYGEVDG